MSPLFFISRSRSPSLFFSLSFAGLPPTFSFPLSFSCSIFQICGHDNSSKLNTLDNTDSKTISAFRFLLYWLFRCVCFTRRGWQCHFPPKLPRVAFGLPCLSIELFSDRVCLWCARTGGWACGRTVTWLPKFLGWVDNQIFLPMVIRFARFARESSATILHSWRFYCLLLVPRWPKSPMNLCSTATGDR